jgi:hypothetical protein
MPRTYAQRRIQMEQDLRNFEDVDSLPFDKDTSQYLSVKGKRGRGKGKEKTFNPSPLTFSQNQILSSKCLTE